ncbi:MAG TPA: hypothetical protein VFV86_06735 [Nitrososphaeraceae archaeon]|nr:hypothetical protein [Nitrososphaeraceae archaeon]
MTITSTTTNQEDTKDIDFLLIEYKDTISRLRCLYIQLEDKLKKEKGMSQSDVIVFLDKTFRETIKDSINNNTNNIQKQEQSSSTDLINKNNLPLYFQHYK